MVRILIGDVREQLKLLADESVHCVVTSPPYFGLRDYGMDGQIGLEASPAEFLATMVDVFREVRRVLRSDGTCWVNMGDSYAGSWGAQGRPQGDGQMAGRSVTSARQIAAHPRFEGNTGTVGKEWNLKPKDKMLIPHRLAIALCDDGWYVRDDIVWAKPNPMPESIRDRCTKAHEYVFQLAKSARYYYDFAAMQEPSSDGTHARLPGNARPAKGAQAYLDGAEEHRTKEGLLAYAERQRAKYKTPDGWDTTKGEGGHGSFHREGREAGRVGYEHKPSHNSTESRKSRARDDSKSAPTSERNGIRKLADPGSGTKNNESFDAAMAVMPETRNKRSVWTVATAPFSEAHFATFPPALIEPCILAGCPQGGVVLDPFAGAFTTALVCERLQRDSIAIELNPAYVEIGKRRLLQESPMFTEILEVA